MKIVTISDNPLSGTGVAHQMMLIIEGLFQKIPGVEVLSLGIQPIQPSQPREGWTLEPLTDKPAEKLLSVLRRERIDCLVFMTDPRFYMWLTSIEHDVKNLVPNIHYYHVWDNYPAPRFNKPFYDCFDEISCISKLTYNICKTVGYPERQLAYVPHALEPEVFKPASDRENKVFTILWDSVNIKRKSAQTAIIAFSQFLKKHPDSHLVMKTQAISNYGGNLYAIAADWGVPPTSITFIERRDLSYEQLAYLYSHAHVVMNTSFNEGFGLSILQGLYSGCLCIAPATGGLQDQVPPNAKFGFSVPIDYRYLDNGVECPYIYFDYVKPESYAERLDRAYSIWKNNPKVFEEKCAGAREWALKNFSIESLQNYFVGAVQKRFRSLEAPVFEIQTV